MAGIKGMPGTKPTEVASPVPQEGASASAFDSYQPPKQSAFDSYQPSTGQAAPQAVEQGYQGPGSGVLQTVADYAPAALGIAGGIVGAPAGPAGMAAMGMAGAAAGVGYREYIEQELLGKGIKDPDKIVSRVTEAAGQTGAELLAGEGAFAALGKAGKFAAKTKAGEAVANKIGEAAAPVVKYVGEFTDKIKKDIIKPVTDFLEANMSKGTPEQSGEAVKQSFGKAIAEKFNGFKQSYATINSVAENTPMADVSRKALTDKIKSDVVDLPQPLYNTVKQYTNKIDGASNTAQVHQVISDVNAEVARLSQYQTSGAVRDKIAALQQVADRATDYMENFTLGTARRIASGKASIPEMQAFEQMMANQANPTVPVGKQNLSEYAKSVANDYIKQREGINASYSKFRGFLEDVGEQTGVKAERRGPMQFLRMVNDVPSEQLVERMFLPKNAAALREMSQTSPEVFNVVKQARIRQVYNNSMVDGQVNLTKLANNFDALPESARSLIISDGERSVLRNVANSGSLKAMDRLHQNTVMNFVRGATDITRAGMLATSKVAKDVAATNTAKVLADKAAGSMLSNTFMPPKQQ